MNLLYPNGEIQTKKLSDDAYQHLAVEELVEMIGVTSDEKALVRNVVTVIPQDVETVLYRQEVLKDFLMDKSFCDELSGILGDLDILKEYNERNFFTIRKKSSLWDMISYMEEMEVYVRVLEGLTQFFAAHEVNSEGLKEISKLLQESMSVEKIEELKEIVASLRTEISTLKSVLVGINLSPELRPEEVILLGFNTEPYHSRFIKTATGLSIAVGYKVRYREPSQFMKYICDDMENALSRTVQKNKQELKKYINLKGYFLLDICNDLRYYLMIARFARRLQDQGHTLCMPMISKDAEAVTMKGIYNIRLTERNIEQIVKNDFCFSEQEKLFILTGPNRGGKTILTQAVGMNALMAAIGLFVTADAYEGFLFEDILTHFPADENQTLDLGRLGEEAVRVQKIVKQATPRTLVLLNETYSSTSAYDGLYMASDLVHILKHKNIPMIFNTHIHELACNTDKMNEWDGPSRVVSLSMEILNQKNTFRVLRKEPDRESYAHNIATKYGVTYEMMLD